MTIRISPSIVRRNSAMALKRHKPIVCKILSAPVSITLSINGKSRSTTVPDIFRAQIRSGRIDINGTKMSVSFGENHYEIPIDVNTFCEIYLADNSIMQEQICRLWA